MRPNFLFIGPDKSGSSWLFRVLATHSEVYVSPAKDLYYFDRYYGRGSEWYFSRFAAAGPGHRVVGEVCHDYLYCPDAPARIEHTLGHETRILTCLREPVDRAYSDYWNRIRSGTIPEIPFASALDKFPQLLRAGEYANWLKPYFDVFGRSNIRVAAFDDLAADPQLFLNSTCQWLGISDLALTDAQRGPVRPAAVSRSRAVTRLVRCGAEVARSVGLEGAVGRLKSLSAIDSALYRTLDSKPAIPTETLAAARSRVRDDVLALTALTGINFAERWGYK